MGNFIRVASLVILAGFGLAIYDLVTGDPVPAEKTIAAKTPIKRAPVSRTPPIRVKADRTLGKVDTMPAYTAPLEAMVKEKGGSIVPVLMPPQAVESMAKMESHRTRLKITDSGYTGVVTLPDMNVVIYGTKKAFRKPAKIKAERAELEAKAKATLDRSTDGNAQQPLLPPARPEYTMAYEDADDGRGGSLSFGRFGMDYHIEFYCHDDVEGCVDEKRAHAFLDQMMNPPVRKAEEDKPKSGGLKINIGIGVRTDSGGGSTPNEPTTGGTPE